MNFFTKETTTCKFEKQKGIIAEHPYKIVSTGKPKTGKSRQYKKLFMAVKHVDLADCYIPKTSNQDIVVDVEIGDGQNGSYAIFLGANFIDANAPAILGKKTDVLGKKTTVSAIIIDELQETNWTSMTVVVSEGTNSTRFGPYKMQAENHLDTIIYTLKLVHE